MTTKPLESITFDTGPNPVKSIIWMHGLGADGNDFAPIAGQLNLDSCGPVRFIFPHAPRIPVTLNGGYVMPAWYDIAGPGAVQREDAAGLAVSQARIEQLIAIERARGVAANHIVLAGFSQGSAMVLQTGLRHPEALAGLMCLSGYLPLADRIANERHAANQTTPIFMVHGRHDPVIPIARARLSFDGLSMLGYQVEWHDYAMEHSVNDQEIADIGTWLRKVLA
jgi:phospholipase/carboxylesterase